MDEIQLILGVIIILATITAGVVAGIKREVPLTVFYVWLILVIISRIQILIWE